MASALERRHIHCMDDRHPVENLADRAQLTQRRLGVAAVFLGLGAAIAMQRASMSGAFRVVLLPLFVVGSYGLFAGVAKTCALTAFRGFRITECGLEPIADRRELAGVRKRGMRVVLTSIVVSILAVALLAWLH